MKTSLFKLIKIVKPIPMKSQYRYGCGYDTIQVCGYTIFLKFRIRYGYDTLTKICNKTYMYVKYLKKINIDYSSLLYYYKSYNFLKNNTCDQNNFFLKFSYKQYYIFHMWT